MKQIRSPCQSLLAVRITVVNLNQEYEQTLSTLFSNTIKHSQVKKVISTADVNLKQE